HAIYTHALTFLLVTLVVKLWTDDPATAADYAVLGFVLGLATAVRWQSAVFALLPAISLFRHLRRREWRFVSSCGLICAGAFLVGVFPQLLSWKTIYDRFYVGVPLGADYVRWGDPFLSEILFSSRHGLFSWSPILILAALGLFGFIRSEPRKGLPLAGVALIVWYVNSTVADWWGGGSFGARRFDAVVPILALGLGTTIAWLTELVRRRPRAVVGVLVAAVVMANALLMEQYRKGRIPVDDTMSWEVAIAGGVQDWFDAFGYPFSFPMNWLFAMRYDRPKTQYDILVGQYLFHRMHDLGGVIDLGPRDPPFLGNGWSGLKDWQGRKREVRLAEGRPASLFIPVDQPEPLRIHIACAAPEGTEPVAIEVRLNGVRLTGFVPTRDMVEHSMSAEAALWKRINVLELAPVDGDPIGAFLAVDRLRFERLQ
ncbi:MAG TPA: hypothetical protein VLK65_19125, partial [Vicinamibacteria bacterium]|nr:hypothetical protein [Vicinamibacteria bacterium]